MPTTFEQDYRPITASGTVGEVGDGDGLSTRAVRDHLRNVNVFAGRTLPRVLWYQQWTTRNGTNWDPWRQYATPAATVRDQMMALVRFGYTTAQIKLFARNQAGVGTSTFRLYSDTRLYTSAFSSDATSVSRAITSNTLAWYEDEITLTLPVTGDRVTFLAVESTNTGGAVLELRTMLVVLKGMGL